MRDLTGARLCEAYETQLQHLRVIHADQHPGNFLFQPDGRLGLVDFGSVKRVDFDIREFRRFQEEFGWRESDAAERRFLSILYGKAFGKAVPHARARKILPLMEEILDTYRPQRAADYVINFRNQQQNSRAREIQGRMARLILQDKLINPDLIYAQRGDMGFWHLLGEIGATVNVSEISRRVSATPPATR